MLVLHSTLLIFSLDTFLPLSELLYKAFNELNHLINVTLVLSLNLNYPYSYQSMMRIMASDLRQLDYASYQSTS